MFGTTLWHAVSLNWARRTHTRTHTCISQICTPLLCLYPFLSILKEAVVPHPLRLGQVAVPRLECGNPASGLSPGLADYLSDLLGSLCPSALNDKDHPTQIPQILRPFPQMLVGRANCLFHLSHRPSGSPPWLYLHLFIYFVSPPLSEHNPHDASCLCSLRIFQPTDFFFFLLCFVSVHFFPCQGYWDSWFILRWLSGRCICLCTCSPRWYPSMFL